MHVVVVLALIQGITEFIPVSSSSHLYIISNYFKLDEQSLLLDVSLHIGSFLAVISFFYKDIFDFFKKKEIIFQNYHCINSSNDFRISFSQNKFNSSFKKY